MSQNEQVAKANHIALVEHANSGATDAGSALVFGPFPPLINSSASHASSVLHMFKSTGHRINSATGPGMALALHHITFSSETKFRESLAFIDDDENRNYAVIYAKALEFSKISKPFWYKRRLEELRRLRFFWKVVRRYERSAIVFEHNRWLSRDQLSFWVLSKLASLGSANSIQSFNATGKVEALFEELTGQKRRPPPDHLAEDTAYNAAFGAISTPKVRLTPVRVRQALNFWLGRCLRGEGEQVSSDVRQLLDVALKHDLRKLPQFSLLWRSGAIVGSSTDVGRAPEFLKRLNTQLSAAESYGVPLTKYMRHLGETSHPDAPVSIHSRAEAKNLLSWYLGEAKDRSSQSQIPLPRSAVAFYFEKMIGSALPQLDEDDELAHTLGRDAAPFSLSKELVRLYKATPELEEKYDLDDQIDRLSFVLEVLLRSVGPRKGTDLIGQSAADYLMQPIGADPRNISRLELLIAMQFRCEIQDKIGIEQPWSYLEIADWVAFQSKSIFPALSGLLRRRRQKPIGRKSIKLTGLPKSETGVGSNLHMSLAAFRELGLEPEVHDAADDMRSLDLVGEDRPVRRLKRPLVLHHVNADQIPQFMTASTRFARHDAVHVGFLLWEFDVLPSSHKLALDLLDEIWTPTEFLQRIYAAQTEKPVHNVLKGLHIPQVEKYDLGRLQIPRDATVFLTCFDFHSSVARKNPLAAVRAFQKAFPDKQSNERLIIKTTPMNDKHWGDPEGQMRQILGAAKSDRRIRVIAEYLSFNALLSLIASVDCLISPHRAEGFGLMPAYALGLKTPVMATDYSGTTDFCTPETSFTIPFETVPVAPHQVISPVEGASWAEIDISALAHELQNFAEDKTEGQDRARVGHALITSRFSPLEQAKRYRGRLDALGVL